MKSNQIKHISLPWLPLGHMLTIYRYPRDFSNLYSTRNCIPIVAKPTQPVQADLLPLSPRCARSLPLLPPKKKIECPFWVLLTSPLLKYQALDRIQEGPRHHSKFTRPHESYVISLTSYHASLFRTGIFQIHQTSLTITKLTLAVCPQLVNVDTGIEQSQCVRLCIKDLVKLIVVYSAAGI